MRPRPRSLAENGGPDFPLPKPSFFQVPGDLPQKSTQDKAEAYCESEVHQVRQKVSCAHLRSPPFCPKDTRTPPYNSSVDGRAHERLTLFHLAWTGLALSALMPDQAPQVSLLYMAGGAVGTLYLSPDIDLPDSRASKRWGFLSLLWEPYRVFHPHRGTSHSWVYGPLSRLLYLFFPSFVLLLVLGVDPAPLLRPLLNLKVSAPLLAGYLFSQWAHLVQDGVEFRVV